MGKPMKRPASGSLPDRELEKKPSSATALDWAAASSEPAATHDDDLDDAPDDASVQLIDKSTITPQQRHVWKKALNSGLPPLVKEEWERASQKGPKERNLVINATIPRAATYATEPNFTPAVLNRLKEISKIQRRDQSSMGKTLTQLLGEGYTQKLIDDGLERGDVTEEHGLYYMRTDLRVVSDVATDTRSANTTTPKEVEWDELSKELEFHDWALFSLCNKRAKAIKDTSVEKKPPSSEEAQKHLQDATDAAARVLANVRKIARELMKLKKSENPTWKHSMDNSLTLGSRIEGDFLCHMNAMLTSDVEETSDQNIKDILRKMAKPFKELEDFERDLSAILRNERRRQ